MPIQMFRDHCQSSNWSESPSFLANGEDMAFQEGDLLLPKTLSWYWWRKITLPLGLILDRMREHQHIKILQRTVHNSDRLSHTLGIFFPLLLSSWTKEGAANIYTLSIGASGFHYTFWEFLFCIFKLWFT